MTNFEDNNTYYSNNLSLKFIAICITIDFSTHCTEHAQEEREKTTKADPRAK
jgi:hypothetical protein